jgi:putative ABC transport system permease protein
VKEFFGVDMTLIMFVLLGMLAVALATVAFVFIWNRVMFMVGVRNIPRRRAQTTLIIIGLMLSTLIISAAFSVGDTADYSISNTAYDRLHSVDETVVTKAESGESDSSSLINAQPIDQDTANDYVRQIKDTDGVDGALAVMRWPGAATNETKGQSEPLVLLFGVDPTQLAGFESDFVTTGGERVNPGELENSEIYANESAADELDLQAGDVVTLFVANQPSTFTVKDVLKDRLLTGAAFGVSQGFVTSLDRLQALTGREGQVDTIAISNDGGVRDGLKHSKSVTERLNRTVFNGANVQVDETKRDFVDIAADISSAFTTIFIVLGLFSIAAGLMLIFLIFVMLAAER